MKRILGFVTLAAASFLGVFGALKFEKWNDHRTNPPVEFTPASESRAPMGLGRSVDLDNAVTMDFRSAAKKVLPSVVSVDRLQAMEDMFGRSRGVQTTGTGSGVIIDGNGTIVTNNHVVEDASEVRVRLNDHRTVPAKVLGTDPRTDIAVLKIDAKDLTPIDLGDSSKVEVGQWVVAIGNPLGYSGTVSIGVVSSLGRNLATERSFLTDTIQTDAAINQGNSGGALTDSNGRLIGINSAIASNNGGGSIGIGFAIPVNRVKTIAREIVQYGRARHAGLGVELVNARFDGVLESDNRIRQQLTEQLGSEPPRYGVIVYSAPGNGSAAKAGIRDLDILMEVAGKKTTNSLDLYEAMTDRKPGETVSVTYWSKGSVKTTKVTLQEVQ